MKKKERDCMMSSEGEEKMSRFTPQEKKEFFFDRFELKEKLSYISYHFTPNNKLTELFKLKHHEIIREILKVVHEVCFEVYEEFFYDHESDIEQISEETSNYEHGILHYDLFYLAFFFEFDVLKVELFLLIKPYRSHSLI